MYAILQEQTGELLVELGSDQTSCHAPFDGGYYPVQLSFTEANEVSQCMMYRPDSERPRAAF